MKHNHIFFKRSGSNSITGAVTSHFRIMCLAVLVLALAFQAAPASRAYAASISVDSVLDTAAAGDGSCTLREALLNAENDADLTGGDCAPGSGDDTITLDITGVIALDGGSFPGINTGITISGPGATVLTLDGKDASGIFSVMAAGRLNLEEVALANANAVFSSAVENYGTLNVLNCTFSSNIGGIINYPGGSVTVTGSLFSDNYLGRGGGIYNDGGVVSVANSTFSGNTGQIEGGGIYNSGGTLTVTGSTFLNNSTTYNPLFGGGGGISNRSGTAIVMNSTFSGNQAGYWMGSGGGILNESGTLVVVDSTFSENSASYGGGGIANRWYSRMTVDRSTFFANRANQGGGIYNWYNSIPVTITNSTFSANIINSSYSLGGGIANVAGTLTMIHSTLSGNTSAIFNPTDGTVTLRNTILANSAMRNCEGQVIDGGSNLVYPGDGSCTNPGFLVADPLLGPLQDNGGPTFTHALLPGSPAIDAVPLAGCAGVVVDQRSVARPQGPACDTGAYELKTPQQRIQDLIDAVTGIGSLNQGQANALSAKLKGAINKLNQGLDHAAINELQAFIKQVEAMITSGILLPAEGEPLIEVANEIIAVLSR